MQCIIMALFWVVWLELYGSLDEDSCQDLVFMRGRIEFRILYGVDF